MHIDDWSRVEFGHAAIPPPSRCPLRRPIRRRRRAHKRARRASRTRPDCSAAMAAAPRALNEPVGLPALQLQPEVAIGHPRGALIDTQHWRLPDVVDNSRRGGHDVTEADHAVPYSSRSPCHCGVVAAGCTRICIRLKLFERLRDNSPEFIYAGGAALSAGYQIPTRDAVCNHAPQHPSRPV